VPIHEVRPIATHHVSDVFDLAFADAPDEIARAFAAAAVA
jgi:hypothetical protein